MASLVSQDDALAQLRLVEAALTPAQLQDVNNKAEQASYIIVDYLKRSFIDGPLTINPFRAAPRDVSDVTDPGTGNGWWGWSDPPPPVVPPTPAPPWTQTSCPSLVKAAILIVLTSLYDGRTPDDTLLSDSLTGILTRFRDPALA
jgi:hypothetical protein